MLKLLPVLTVIFCVSKVVVLQEVNTTEVNYTEIDHTEISDAENSTDYMTTTVDSTTVYDVTDTVRAGLPIEKLLSPINLELERKSNKPIDNRPYHINGCPLPTVNSCPPSQYYSLDGSCNNQRNPTWGQAKNSFGRLVRAQYSDGVSKPAKATNGDQLPNARALSLLIFDELDNPDPELTLANMQWGNIVAHDLSFAAGSRQTKPHHIRCCTEDGYLVEGQEKNRKCFPILIPPNDPVLKGECMNLVRTETDRHHHCPRKTGPVEQVSMVTAFLDLSYLYGNSEEELSKIRAFTNGGMLVEERKDQTFPPHHPNTTETCDVKREDDVCYLTGDSRANQNPGLTALQIIVLREHNRIADQLAYLNPHWDDEILFQETRRINIAQYQHINYYEWLPLSLGRDNMIENNLIYDVPPGSYVSDYCENTNPFILNEFTTAAFRYFHTQIEGRLDLHSEARTVDKTLRLSDTFNRPGVLEKGRTLDKIIRGLATQPEQCADENIDREVRHFLFRSGFGGTGRDLRAIDIQRGRDHGLPTYNDFREFCGIKRAYSWDDYLDLIDQEAVDKMRSIYDSFEDVDLMIGGALEEDVDGSFIGPTFLCLSMNQFHRTRIGDRLFFENSPANDETGFTRDQLEQIRKSSFARLLCNNVRDLEFIQPEAFRLISDTNVLVPCKKIKKIDLTKWKNYQPDDIQRKKCTDKTKYGW